MLRNALAFIGALVAAFLVISLLQFLNSLVFPPPAGMDYNNPEHLAALMASIPVGALFGVELSYILGSLAGGAVVGWLARSHTLRLALGLGAFLTLMNILNLLSVPHPFWLAVLTTVTFLPLVWAAAKWSGARWGAVQ